VTRFLPRRARTPKAIAARRSRAHAIVFAATCAWLAAGATALAQTGDDDDAAASAGADDDESDDTGSEALPAKPARTTGTPAPGRASTYTIRAGDTLSTVSRDYLRDPTGWPKLWALNPEIPNPHWIYPGQVVRVRDGTAPQKVTTVVDRSLATAAPEDDARSRRPDARPSLVTTRVLSHPPRTQAEIPHLRQVGFVDEGTLKTTGTINGSVEEKIMLATGDQAYVQFPPGHPPKANARYSVYQVDTDNPVREPGSTAVLGYLVHVCGQVVIDRVSVDRSISDGRLLDLAEPVERGYRVGPLIPDALAVVPKPNGVSVTARVIAAMNPGSLIGNQAFVVLNRGRRHGVEAGNRFLILRQGDGLKRMLESWDTVDPRFPPHTIAEVLAVDVGDETTVGWISRGSRELRVGDVADLQRGY